MRLIDGDALEKEGWSLCRTFQKDKGTMVYEAKKPSDFPTIEERRKGKWIIRETAFEDTEAKCSNCGFVTLVNEPENGLHMVSDLLFCPRCGSFNAMMEGEQP